MTTDAEVAEAIAEAIALENNAHEVVLTMLQDKDFMRGVLEAQKESASGKMGETLESVKARLGIG